MKSAAQVSVIGSLRLLFLKAVQLKKVNSSIIFFVSYKRICCEYLKEPSQWDGSFKYSEHIFC